MLKKSILPSFFLPNTSSEWLGYKNLRELPRNKNYRDLLENLWSTWRPHADSHFQSECQKSEQKFNERFWEMYLGCSLIEKSHKVISKNIGPDIALDISDQKIWIEATVPNSGEVNNPNSVPKMEFEEIDLEADEDIPLKGDGFSMSTMENPIRLRYLSAIKSKYCSRDRSKKRRGIITYLAKRIINPSDPIIIAINSANIPVESPGSMMPIILKSCFGFGNYQFHLHLNQETKEIETKGNSYTRSDTAIKIKSLDKKIEINSDIFLRPIYPYISAIIFSYARLARVPFGGEFIVIHNPFAKNPLPLKKLNIGNEFWLEGIKYNDTKNLILDAKVNSTGWPY